MGKLILQTAVTGLLLYAASKTVLKDSTLTTLALIWLAMLIVPAGLTVLYRIIIYNNYLSPYRHLPMPTDKPHWFFGHMPIIQAEPPGMANARWIEENDNVPFIRYYGLFQRERLLVSSHTALQSVFMTNAYTFVKSNMTRQALALLIGEGILNAEGDYHKHQRKLISPSFSFGHIKALTPIFLEKSLALSNKLARELDAATNGAVEKYDLEKIINVDEPIHATTLDIIFKAGFGAEFNALENPNDPIVQAYRATFSVDKITLSMKIDKVIGLAVGKPDPLPIKRNRGIRKSRITIHKFAKDLIRERQRELDAAKTQDSYSSAADKNILSIMLIDGQGQWTEDETVNNLMTFLAAGHETTSTATSFALHELSKRLDIQTRLRNEIRASIPDYASYSADDGIDPFASLTYEKIESLKYLNNFCRELLRLRPPVPVTSRTTAADTMVDGVLVKKGTHVICPITGINRKTQYWGEDAATFNPDRWDNLQPLAANAYSFFTFLQGPRSCIGRKFAETEFKCLLIALVGRFEFSERNVGEVLETTSIVTAKFVNGLPIKVKYAT